MPQSTPPAPATKMTWFTIFFALVMSVLIYCLLAYFMSQAPRRPPSPSLGAMRLVVCVLAGVMLAASAGWMYFKTYGKIGDAPQTMSQSLSSPQSVLLEPGEFQTVSIIGLALAEACSIYGLLLFFMGAPQNELWYFAAATIVFDLVFILPKGIKYWAAWENQQKTNQNQPL